MPITKLSLLKKDNQGMKAKVASTGGYYNSNNSQTKSGLAGSSTANMPLTKMAQFAGSGTSVIWTQPMFFSPLHTPQNWQIASRRREVYQWVRFYYDNECKVAAAVDFYSTFPVNGFKLECKNKKVLKYYERQTKRLRLNHWSKLISHEYFLIGDVFPWVEVSCKHCGGSGRLQNGESCNHSGGSVSRIVILNPDWIEVQMNPLVSEPVIALVPDEELRMIVQRKRPKQIYDNLPTRLVELVSTGAPIPLSNRSVSHLKHNPSPYGAYGNPLLRRAFTILAYKTKLMTANWIVAERLILPIRVVKIGDKDRPAAPEDISDVSNQLSAVANDPNLTLVTHHAFDYEWHGACYDESTEILTSEGWKLFEDLNKEETVATYNEKTGQMEYQHPDEYHEYYYNSNMFGDMYRFKARSVDINVTPNHRMLIERKGKLQEVYSQHIKHDDKLLSKTNWIGKIPAELPHEDSPLNHLSLDEYLEFVGYYITEDGSKEETNKGLRKEKQIQACSISQSKTNAAFNSIESSVATAYPKYSTYSDKRRSGCELFTINSVKIARYLSKEFGSHSWNKKIPKWILDLPKDKLQIIYKAMMDGDGESRHDTQTSRHRYTTISKQLADNWSEICLKIGYWPTISTEDNSKKNPNQKLIYRVYCSEMRKNVKFNLRKQHILREEYDGQVYCVKVPNSWVFVRKNGKIAICGNTGKIHNINNELEFIGKELLDGFMLNQALLNGEMGSYCHSEDTLTLTDSGFKRYDEITEKDKVACYNPDTKTLEYHNYYQKHVFDYEGDLIHFNTDKVDILVTPNHRMYAQPREKEGFRFIEAKDVKRRAKLIGCVEDFAGEYQESVEIGEQEYSIYDFCELVGFYVSEGYTEKDRGKIKSFAISQTEKGNAYTQVSDLYNRCFKKYYKTEKDFITYNEDLANYFKNNFGGSSITKRIPSWVKNLSKECLEIILKSAILGDGTHMFSNDGRKNGHYKYLTSSKQLSQDIEEIAFKCGYTTSITMRTVKQIQENKTKRYFNKTGHEYITRHDQYIVTLSKGFKGKYPVLETKREDKNGKEITKKSYSGKVYCFTVPHGLFVTKRNDKITIQGNSAAQVGVEVMIRRLESWRAMLAEWIEQHIFLPIAMMQGFIDEEESKEIGETVYLHPTIKWNDLQLRDTSSQKQMLVQLHDKGLISSQTLLEEFDMDYDQEIERIREEAIHVGPQGQMGGGMGGMPGMPGGDMGGGMGGGMPGGEMGGMPGGGMGGGMTGGIPGGDMGGMPGGMGGGMPGGMGAAAGSPLKVEKRGKGKTPQEQAEPEVQPMLKLTKLEGRMYKMLMGLDLPSQYSTFAQYKVAVAGEQQPYVIDFAIPNIGMGLECLHPDTLVLTNNGTKKANDVTKEDKLVGRDGNYVDIVKKHINANKNNMMSIKAYGSPEIYLTKNHPVLVSKPKKIRVKRKETKITRTRSHTIPDEPKFVSVEDITKGDYLLVPKVKNSSIMNSINLERYNDRKLAHNSKVIPDKLDLNKETGWLMGMYLAEGNSCGNNVTFSLNQNEKEYADKILKYMKKYFNLNGKKYNSIKDKGMRVCFCCKSLVNFFKSNFNKYSYTKSLSEWIFKANSNFIEAVIDGHCDGDGCRDKKRQRHVTASPYLANDIQRLYFSLDKVSNISVAKRGGLIHTFANNKKYKVRDLYEVSYYFNRSKLRYKEDDQYFYLPINNIKEKEYCGDFTVNFETTGNGESDHTFVVHNIITHNCDGKIWHDQVDSKAHDIQRDQKLSNIGWRILRFNEEAIEEQIDAVRNVVVKNIKEAIKQRKKAQDEGIIKTANEIVQTNDPSKLIYKKVDLENNLGYMYLIGT